MSPSDQFMAAYVVVVVTFLFLFYFLAKVATKNRTLVLFYGALNSVFYLGCFVLWVLFSFLLCVIKKLPLCVQCIIAVCP